MFFKGVGTTNQIMMTRSYCYFSERLWYFLQQMRKARAFLHSGASKASLLVVDIRRWIFFQDIRVQRVILQKMSIFFLGHLKTNTIGAVPDKLHSGVADHCVFFFFRSFIPAPKMRVGQQQDTTAKYILINLSTVNSMHVNSIQYS